MNMNVCINPGERLDDLQLNGLKLIQRPDAFRFGTDSVLLAAFCSSSLRFFHKEILKVLP